MKKDLMLQAAPGWKLVLYWALTLSLVCPFSAAIALMARHLQSSNGRTLQVQLELGSAITCILVIGLAQRHVLCRYVNLGLHWVWATASGVGLIAGIYILVFVLLYSSGSLVDGLRPEGWGLAWVASGFAQYLVLKKFVARAGWWILANIVAGTLAFLLGSIINMLLSPDQEWLGLSDDLNNSPLAWVISVTVATVAAGAYTGVIMAWLLEQPTSECNDQFSPDETLKDE
jgi:hypothetical protein